MTKQLPTLAPQRADEPVYLFGLRAFRFLVTERIPVSLLASYERKAALHASQTIVTSPLDQYLTADEALRLRERWHDVRAQLLASIEDDAARLAALQQQANALDGLQDAPSAPQGDDLRDGGTKVPRPPQGPQPKAGGVSLVSGNPLPSPAVAAQRLIDARNRAAAQNGGVL